MPKRILVIDDEPDVRTFLSGILKAEGYEVILAGDGEEGIATAKRQRPDLVSLDLAMPAQTGTDFYRRLVKEADLKDVPVIVVSGLAGRHLAVKKPVAVFDKPIDRQEYIEAIRRAIGAP